MISTSEARQIILDKCKPLSVTELFLSELSNEVLAAGVKTKIHSPPFHQSAMDGYAIRFDDAKSFTHLKPEGKVMAGEFNTQKLRKGTAMRIFTGAGVPAGADTVVMQEHTRMDKTGLVLTQLPLLQKGANIRLQGSQIKRGQTALPKGHILNAASIGYLAMLGIDKVKVYKRPSVGIIATGNELQLPGKALVGSQIYESNTFTLQALLSEMHFSKVTGKRVRDKESLILAGFKKALTAHDVLLITGGISVGDYDLVAPALTKLGVKTIFHKVAQKPGKPFFFGTKGKKLVFALPGNPAAVITCFLQYVKPALQNMMGYPSVTHSPIMAVSKNDFSKKTGLTHFLKARIDVNGEVEVLTGQESYLLNTYALANCLIEVPAASTGFLKGETVMVHRFNLSF